MEAKLEVKEMRLNLNKGLAMSLSKLSLILFILGSLLTSCSSRNKEETASTTDAMAEEETLDMLDEFEGEDLFALDEQALDENPMEGEEELVFSDDQMEQEPTMEEESWQEPMAQSSPVIQENATYTVQPGDTLMYVAYKKYGDYSKWRSIARMNGMSGGQALLKEGNTLQLDPTMVTELPEVMGQPYVIKRGDTLSKISQKEYGSIERWKDLWRHNSVMIKDPDLIFAGFQMHLLPDGTVALNL